ncbi:hypothetical protein VTO73DRAFT_219 [Trametes versicolor]
MTEIPRSTLNTTPHIFLRMAILAWGFVWLMMSVLIFVAGRFIPRLQSKPPPPAPMPRLSRVPSAPVSPVVSPPKSIASEPDEPVSCETSFGGPAQSVTDTAQPGTLPKKAPSKRKWSLPTRFFGRSAPSPKSSLFSEGSATLVGSPSPTRFFPELPLVESGSPSSELGSVLDLPGSSTSTPASTPHTGRGMRLPGAKALKSLSRKLSTKKPGNVRHSSHSPGASVETLPSTEGSFDYAEDDTRRNPRDVTMQSPKQVRPGHLAHQRQYSLPGEMFSSTFVNPFRSKARKSKAPTAIDLSEPSSSSPKRSTPRRMLTSFSLALTSSSPWTPSEPHSRRSSVSSTSTAVSALSAPSVLSHPSSPPPSVPRTQPYSAPYFAAMPRSSRSPQKDHRARPRASSMSPPRRPETVAEESAEEPVTESEPGHEQGEQLSPLGLKLGQLGHGRPRWQQRESRQRVAVSEGAIRMGAAPEKR